MKILVPLIELELERHLADLATAIAGEDEVVLFSVIEAGEDRSLAEMQPQVRARRRELDALAGPLAHARAVVTVARTGWDAVV